MGHQEAKPDSAVPPQSPPLPPQQKSGIARPLGLYCTGVGIATGFLGLAVPVVIGALAGPVVQSVCLLPCFLSSFLCGTFGRGYFIHRVMNKRNMKMMKPENLWVLPWVWLTGFVGYSASVIALTVTGLSGNCEARAMSQFVSLPPVQAVIKTVDPIIQPSPPPTLHGHHISVRFQDLSKP